MSAVSSPRRASTRPPRSERLGMFTGMSNNDQDHLSDWMAGPGGIVAAIIGLIIGVGLVVALFKDLLG